MNTKINEWIRNCSRRSTNKKNYKAKVDISWEWKYLHSVKVKVAQLCLTLYNPMDHSLPGSSVHGILQARILEWVAIVFSRGSSWPRNWTRVSCVGGEFFASWATRDAPKYLPTNYLLYLPRETIFWTLEKVGDHHLKQVFSVDPINTGKNQHQILPDLMYWEGPIITLVVFPPWKYARLLVAQPCLTLQPHGLYPTRLLCPGIFQARILAWIVISFSRDWTWVSCIAGRSFTVLATREAPWKYRSWI